MTELFVIITVQKMIGHGMQQATWAGTINVGSAMTRLDVYNWVRKNQLPPAFRDDQVWPVFYVAEPNRYLAPAPAPAPAETTAAPAANGGEPS
jgi:hypothetical protein